MSMNDPLCLPAAICRVRRPPGKGNGVLTRPGEMDDRAFLVAHFDGRLLPLDHDAPGPGPI